MTCERSVKHTRQSGNAAIEMAIILPLLLLIVFGVIEFGTFFIKSQIVNRAVSTISDSIQKNPNDPGLQSLAQNSGLSFVSFTTSPNFICAQSYATQNQAQALCSAGMWNTGTPSGVAAGTPYFVAVVAYVRHTPFTTFVPGLTDIRASAIFQVNPAAAAAANCGSSATGFVMVYLNNTWQCKQLPNCSAPGFALTYRSNGSSLIFDCINTQAPPGAACTDNQFLSRDAAGNLFCKQHVTSFNTTVGEISSRFCSGFLPVNADVWQSNCGARFCTLGKGFATGHVVHWACPTSRCDAQVQCW